MKSFIMTFIILAMLTSQTALATFVDDESMSETISCETVYDLTSKPANKVSIINFKNDTDKMIAIYWKSFLGEKVLMSDILAPGNSVKVKFMIRNYFIIEYAENDECIDVLKMRKRNQSVVYK